METIAAFASLQSPSWASFAREWNTAPDYAHAGRFRRPQRQNQSLLARAVIRHVLSLPEHSAFSLPPAIGPDCPFVSITHSKDLIAIAFNGQHAVGIDIEDQSRRCDFKAVANFIFPNRRAPRSVYESAAAFYKFWTGLEAGIKACRRATDAVPALLASRFWRSGTTAEVPIAHHRLSITWRTVDAGYLCAVATAVDCVPGKATAA